MQGIRMMILSIALCLAVGVSAQDAVWEYVTEVEIMDYDRLEQYLQTSEDTLLIVNFWATWCKPCVDEMHYFQQLYNEGVSGRPVRMVLVSLDFRGQTQSKLIPFINRRKIDIPVVHLIDKRMDYWIGQVSALWSGAIPATLVRYRGKEHFFEGAVQSMDDLRRHVSL